MFKPYSNRAWLLILPSLIIVSFVALVPMMTVVNYSVQDVFAGDSFIWVGAHWYQQVLGSTDFHNSLMRSLLYSGLVLAIEVPLGIWIALKMPPTGRLANFYVLIMAVPLLTPWIVVGFLWKTMVDPVAGLIGVGAATLGFDWDMNSVVMNWVTIILMDTWHWTSLIVLLSYAGLQSIPNAHYQAATIDGASRLDVFRYVQFPRIKRVLMIAVMLRFMDSFMVYVEPFVVTRGGPDQATTFLSLDLVQTASIQFDLGEAGAISVIYFAIILLVCWSLFKVMMSGEEQR